MGAADQHQVISSFRDCSSTFPYRRLKLLLVSSPLSQIVLSFPSELHVDLLVSPLCRDVVVIIRSSGVLLTSEVDHDEVCDYIELVFLKSFFSVSGQLLGENNKEPE